MEHCLCCISVLGKNHTDISEAEGPEPGLVKTSSEFLRVRRNFCTFSHRDFS